MTEYINYLTRKDLFDGLVVRRGQGVNAKCYRVVDTTACNYYGEREKRGRYCGIRAWDPEKGEFSGERCGAKPSDLCSNVHWVAKWQNHDAEVLAKARTPEAKEASEVLAFFDGMGAGDLVQPRTDMLLDGTRVVVGWEPRYPNKKVMRKFLVELGVLTNKEDA
jgi:hypothetical protein